MRKPLPLGGAMAVGVVGAWAGVTVAVVGAMAAGVMEAGTMAAGVMAVGATVAGTMVGTTFGTTGNRGLQKPYDPA